MASATEGWSPAARGDHLRVDVVKVLADSKAALEPVLAVTTGWNHEVAAAATVEQVSGALTNLVYRCASPGAAANPKVIVRVFGTGGKLFSPKDERDIFLLAAEMGLGPKCLVEYENGRVEEFLPGINLSSDSMREPAVAAAIAAAMAVFNVRMLAKLPMAQEAATAAAGLKPDIYDRMRQWYAAAQEVCSDKLKELGLSDLLEEVDAYEARMAALFPSWIGFCHNDLQYGNILLFGASPADGGVNGTDAAAAGPAPVAGSAGGGTLKAADGNSASTGGGLMVKLIDYEYSTLNDVAFDVANYFCEWAYNYHSDEAHFFNDSRLPSQEQQLQFCRAYISAMQRQAAAAAANWPAKRQAVDGGSPSSPDSMLPHAGARLADAILAAGASSGSRAAAVVPTASDGANATTAGTGSEAAVQLLLHKAQAHVALSHLMWGLWGLIQDQTSDVDFDYLSYGKMRIERYHITKRIVLETSS